MILITASVLATPATLDEMLRLSVEHVHRSRLEPGCIAHAVSQDVEQPLRLVFVEQWADQPALEVHFSVPESRFFAKALYKLSGQAPHMQVFEARSLPIAP